MSDLTHVKISFDAENLLVDMMMNMPELSSIEYNIRTAAYELRHHDFVNEVRLQVGGYLSYPRQDKIDWEYVASHWWDEAQVQKQVAEDYDKHVTYLWNNR